MLPTMDDGPTASGSFHIKVPKTSGAMLENDSKRIAGRDAKHQRLNESNEKHENQIIQASTRKDMISVLPNEIKHNHSYVQ